MLLGWLREAEPDIVWSEASDHAQKWAVGTDQKNGWLTQKGVMANRNRHWFGVLHSLSSRQAVSAGQPHVSNSPRMYRRFAQSGRAQGNGHQG